MSTEGINHIFSHFQAKNYTHEVATLGEFIIHYTADKLEESTGYKGSIEIEAIYYDDIDVMDVIDELATVTGRDLLGEIHERIEE